MISTNTNVHATDVQRIEADCKRLGPNCPKTISLDVTLDGCRITIFLTDEGVDRVADAIHTAVRSFQQSEQREANEERMAHAVNGCTGCGLETARQTVKENGLEAYFEKAGEYEMYADICRAYRYLSGVKASPAEVLASIGTPKQ